MPQSLRKSLFVLLAFVSCFPSLYAENMGHRNLADLDGFSWKKAFSTANGRILSSDNTPTGKGESLHLAVHFEGKGFTYYNATPFDENFMLPGKVKGVRLVGKLAGDSCGWKVAFSVKDGEKDRRYEWEGLKLTEDWQEYSFTIPTDWPPVTGVNISANNWSNKTSKLNCDLFVSALDVYTDLSAVKERSFLLSVQTSTGRARNLFKQGEDLSLTVAAGSWLNEDLQGKLNISIIDPRGKIVFQESETIVLKDDFSKKITHRPALFGVYTVQTKLDFGQGLVFNSDSQCASIPTAPVYTEEEQRYAPWGINIHGAIEGVSYSSIRELGFQWIRDYAYNEEWLQRGRGNGDWSGWPWYLPMEDKRAASGLMLLPCIPGGISNHFKEHPIPPRGWMDNVIYFMLKFPQYGALEIDNEVDLHYPDLVKKDDFMSYGLYHQAFANIVRAINPDVWVVEQGHAGIKTEMIEKAISRGHFDNVDVVNAHFYCGTSPALMAKRNANTGQGGEMLGNIYDQISEFVKRADMDGKDRQAWLTEFGWDTLVMHIVDEHTQAAYTQRGYAMGFAAGLDKIFLYWNRDTKEVPDTFFDGMGIFDPQDEPKPVAVAMSAMIHFLKMPKPVGTFYPGENGFGYVFEDRDRLVGLAFKIDPEKPGPTVEFATGNLFDFYANPLTERKQTLDIDPVWIENMKETDPFVEQTDYKQLSNRYIRGAAGDTVMLAFEFNNQRKTAYTVTVENSAPQGWKVLSQPKPITLLPRETKSMQVEVQVDPSAQPGDQQIWSTLSDGTVTKKVLTEIQVVTAASIGTLTLSGAPGTIDLPVQLTNNSLSTRSYRVSAQLPSGWKAEPAELEFLNMTGRSEATGVFKVSWNASYKADVPAKLIVKDETDTVVWSQGVVPSAFAIPKASNIICDGDFSDWPTGAELPSWIVGTLGNLRGLKLRVSYAEEGIYLGVEVTPSTAKGDQPDQFWSCDVLEVCIDTQNSKTPREAYTVFDHQFWIVPKVAENSTYLGRWKRNDEIEKVQYDMPHRGYSKKSDGGYILEVLIPAKDIKGYNPVSGSKIGLGISLTVPSRFGGQVEAYWPLPKTENIITNPHLWGSVELK